MQVVEEQMVQAMEEVLLLGVVETLALLVVLEHHHLLQLSLEQIQQAQQTMQALYVSPQEALERAEE
jgi:hypothetical protein